MAQDNEPRLVPGTASGPQHFVPPSSRELRAQAVHRLQIGLFGLAAMLLLVALANIIMDRARQTEAESAPAGTAASAPAQSGRSDPLADIGVVPSADSSDSPKQGAPRR